MAQRAAILLACMIFVAGCSVRKLAVNELGDALAAGGTTFTSDNDPELVGDALPFTLKLMESLLAESPDHQGLLQALTSGFTQYSGGWVHPEADRLEEEDLEAAQAKKVRARNLYLRARDYGLRGLRLNIDDFRRDPAGAVDHFGRSDVPLLYWTGAAQLLAISLSKDDPEVVADLPLVEALIDRALALDESFDGGAIHVVLIGYEPNRPGASGDPAERVRRHFDRAVELSGGLQASPFVTFAENVSVNAQNREEFESLLKTALTIDVNAKPEWRLANLISQRRGKWLLERIDDLFLNSEQPSEESEQPSEEPNDP